MGNRHSFVHICGRLQKENRGRSSAVGLYVTSFYVGGSMGAFLPGLAWTSGGWPACVAMVVAMLGAMALIAALAYRDTAI